MSKWQPPPEIFKTQKKVRYLICQRCKEEIMPSLGFAFDPLFCRECMTMSEMWVYTLMVDVEYRMILDVISEGRNWKELYTEIKDREKF